jgi:ribonuclease T2
MKTYWIGMNESSDMFHAHEWSKHGTCWNDPIPTVNQTRKMNDYFAAAIAVAFKINMYEVLAESDIVPSNTAYTLKQFVLALNTTWGPGTFGIDCQDDTSGNQYLNDISLCLSLDYNIIECPDYVSSSCEEGDIYYLPINFENDKTVHSSEMDEDFLTTSKYQSNIFYDYIPSKFMT